MPIAYWPIVSTDNPVKYLNLAQANISDSIGTNFLVGSWQTAVFFATDRKGNANSAFYLNTTVSSWFLSKPVNVTEFTLALWIKVVNATNDFRIFASGTGNILILSVKSRKFQFGFTVNSQSGEEYDSNNIIINTWYHIAFAKSQTGLALYKNGSQVIYSSFNSPDLHLYTLNGNGQSFVLGTNQVSDGTSNEVIDDIKLFDFALNAVQAAGMTP